MFYCNLECIYLTFGVGHHWMTNVKSYVIHNLYN